MSGARDSSRAAISRRVIEARRKGTKIDIEYDEVPGLLDSVLDACKTTCETNTARVRDLAKKIDDMASAHGGTRRTA